MAKKPTDIAINAESLTPEQRAALEEAATPERNIVWVGVRPPRVVEDEHDHGRHGRAPEGDRDPWIDQEPKTFITLPDFPEGFHLPDAATQRVGFYHEHAGMIIRDFPGYKEPQQLGRKE